MTYEERDYKGKIPTKGKQLHINLSPDKYYCKILYSKWWVLKISFLRGI